MLTRTRNTYHLLARPWHTDQWLATFAKRETKAIVEITTGETIKDTFKAVETCQRQLQRDGKRLYLSCNCAVCSPGATTKEVVYINGIAVIETTTKVVDSGIVAPIDAIKHKNVAHGPRATVYRCACRETSVERKSCRKCHCPVSIATRILAVNGKEVSGSTKPTAYKCACGDGLLVTYKYSPKPCKACKQHFTVAERVYADVATRRGLKLEHDHANGKGNCKACLAEKERTAHNNAARNPVCNEALVCAGDATTDGFSRTIAVRYLSKRMVYSPRTTAKGRDLEATPLSKTTVKERKASSSTHSLPNYMATDVEDIMQTAFLVWLTGELGNWTFKRTGNRLQDTCNACRMALLAFRRDKYKQKIVSSVDYHADLVARGHISGKTSERSRENAHYDDELEALLSVAREHGIRNQNEMAMALGVSKGEVSKRISKLRERILPTMR